MYVIHAMHACELCGRECMHVCVVSSSFAQGIGMDDTGAVYARMYVCMHACT